MTTEYALIFSEDGGTTWSAPSSPTDEERAEKYYSNYLDRERELKDGFQAFRGVLTSELFNAGMAQLRMRQARIVKRVVGEWSEGD